MTGSESDPAADPEIAGTAYAEVAGAEPETADLPEVRHLVEMLYPELRRIAAIHMRRERHDHTLQPTALVSEVFLKLANNANIRWRDRNHFLLAASKAMRLLLIDHGRSHNAEKHGGKAERLQFQDVDAPQIDRSIEYLEVHEVLKRMTAVDPRMAAVVELRIFGGLTFREVGEVLGVCEKTAKRDWAVARAWLFGELRGGLSDERGGVGKD